MHLAGENNNVYMRHLAKDVFYVKRAFVHIFVDLNAHSQETLCKQKHLTV